MVREADNPATALLPALPAATAGAPAVPKRRATDRCRASVDVLSADELAQRLGCEPEHINALAASHALPAIKIGRSWRFPTSALNAFLHARAMAHLAMTPADYSTGEPTLAGSRRASRPADLNRTVKVA